MIRQILSGQMDPAQLLALVIGLVLGITVHEFGHAAMATWLGDTLPRRQGRLTLSPIAHLDLMGSLMFIAGGFGWGKPVMFNPYSLSTSPRTGAALVAIAGPVMNVILALLLTLPARIIPLVADIPPQFLLGMNDANGILFQILVFIIYYNLMLSMFNLIPVFPLDGFSVLQGIVPPAFAEWMEQIKPYGMFILLLLLLGGSSLLAPILYDPLYALLRLLIFAGA